MSFLAAFRFLTVLPFFRSRVFTPEQIGRSVAYFPVIGAIIGLVLAGLALGLSVILPPAIVILILIFSLVGLTGALHLDGMADTCDGLSGHTPEERLRIMKDSRIGSFGAVGIAAVLLFKFAALSSLPGPLLALSLFVIPVISRCMMAYAIYFFPYARPAGTGKTFKEKTGSKSLLIATIVALAVAVIVGRLAGLVIIVVVWLMGVSVAAFLTRRLGGLTGDTYGAINEISEVSALVLVNLLAYNQWLGV